MSRAIEMDRVRRVLAADAAVEVWNHPDAILREAARRSKDARNKKLRAWIAARLRYALTPDQYRDEFGGVQPEWPRAIPFPIAGGDGGAMAFVSADPRHPLPLSSHDPIALLGGVEAIENWLSSRLSMELRASVWLPQPAHGASVGLAALAAALTASLDRPALNMPPLRWPYPLTGVVNLEQAALETVASETFLRKCATAQSLGYAALWVAQGQQPRQASELKIIEAPRRLAAVLRRLLEELALLNPALYGHFDVVESVAAHLDVKLDGLHGFLPSVLARLTIDPREIDSLRAELGLPPDLGQGSMPQRWEQLVKAYVNASGEGRSARRMRLCHLMLERHALDRERSALSRLTVFLNKREHTGELPAERALMEIDHPRAPASSLEGWLHWTAAAECVGEGQRLEFVRQLVDRGKHEWTALAVSAATRLYAWDRERLQTLRDWIGKSLGSGRLRSDSPLHRRVRTVCRTDFSAIFGEHDPKTWKRQLRVAQVEVCRWPVTNEEYRCFDPSHHADPCSPYKDGPAVKITWYEAFNFAFWAGCSLPTRLEWLSAAAPERWANPYPFLDSCPEHVNYGAGRDGPLTVKERRPGQPPEGGCVDLFGNVWEWVQDWCPARGPGDEMTPGRGTLDCKMALGGGWKSPLEDLRLTTFCPLPPPARLDDVGFRCVKLL